MARHARVVIPNILHHITQRGNRREQIFFNDTDRLFYLEKLHEYSVKGSLDIASYCLMDNHSHLLVVPKLPESLHLTFKPFHTEYSKYLNLRFNRQGINWQGRFFSSPLDEKHAWTAFQYVALNPVRAGIVDHPTKYQWSSAILHTTNSQNYLLTAEDKWLKMAKHALDPYEIDKFMKNDTKIIEQLRRNTAGNLPTGEERFINELEMRFGRRLTLGKAGRPWDKLNVA